MPSRKADAPLGCLGTDYRPNAYGASGLERAAGRNARGMWCATDALEGAVFAGEPGKLVSGRLPDHRLVRSARAHYVGGMQRRAMFRDDRPRKLRRVDLGLRSRRGLGAAAGAVASVNAYPRRTATRRAESRRSRARALTTRAGPTYSTLGAWRADPVHHRLAVGGGAAHLTRPSVAGLCRVQARLASR